MKAVPPRFFILALCGSLLASACDTSKAQEEEGEHEERSKIVVTRPVAEDVISTQQYVCQIHSRRHIEVRALETGYLEGIHVQEGQSVKRGEEMFRIVPVLYQAKLDSEVAEAELAQIKYNNTKVLSDKSVVSNQELALAKAELAKAKAKVMLARAELNFTAVKAPFDGIIDRQHEQQGSLVEEGDILTTMSDNKVMWVYFNVPEARYLEYKARLDQDKDGLDIELQLANGDIFPYKGKIGAIEADFNNQTGNIAFRADFPNPKGLLRHGQTGTILIHRILHNAIVIPQRATYEILAKKYVFVVEPDAKHGAPHSEQHAAADHDKAVDERGGEESAEAKSAAEHGGEHGKQKKSAAEHAGAHSPKGTVHRGIVRQREIVIQEEMDDIYVIKKGLDVKDKIIFEGVRQVRDGDEVEYELRPPEEILHHLKYHAE